MTRDWLTAKWPALAHVRTCVTTRAGGVSKAPWDSFNLATHVGDDAAAVAANRDRLQQALGCQPAWLQQTHSTLVVPADPQQLPEADASWTDQPGIACAVLTADCLPVLFCDREGTRVAAAHAGWRGLADGILEQTVQALAVDPADLLVWFGPAIGPQAFEVGEEVMQVFLGHDEYADQAFEPAAEPGHFHADLYQLARLRLKKLGVQHLYGGGLCTHTDAKRFYSYRRDGEQTGRMASLIWLDSREDS